jgi:tetratricopeptide (TPR) repeat protein
VNKYLKITLSVFVVVIAVSLVYFFGNKSSKKNELSQVSWIPVTHTYRFTNHKAEELSVSAFKLKKEGYYDQAIDLYHEAIKIEHDNPRLYFDLAECYGKNDELQQAVMSMNSAIILDSTYPGFYSNRGMYYYHLFEDEKAVTDLEKAVELDSKSPVYYYNLSLAYYSTNRLEEACNAFKQAKTLGLNTDDSKNQKEFIKLTELCK